MKNSIRFALLAWAAALSSVSPPGYALTLGDLRGAAVIGRTLTVDVQVLANAGEEVSAACFSAEIFYADARQTAAAVALASTGSAGQSALVRIQSTAVVNEPVVTVLLRATCGATTLRRYVLLADFPAAGPAVADSQPAAPTVLSLPAAARPTAMASVVAASPRGNPATAVNGNKATARKAVANGVRKAVPQAAVRPAGKAVLKLDPLNVLSDRMDSLDALMLFAPTADALRQTRDIAALQSDLKTLQDMSAKNAASLVDLRAQLAQAQARQISPLWLYALGAVLALCLALLVWLWQRQRHGSHSTEHWWQLPDDDVAQAPLAQSPLPQSPAPVPPLPVVPPVIKTSAPTPVRAARPATPAVPELAPVVAEQAPAPVAVPATAAHAGLRRISSEAILDLRQQAEFFVSLGQTARAVDILTGQIAHSAEPNPFIHLDLLRLYHALESSANFDRQRDVFMQQFNAQVPDFADFTAPGKDLQAYPEALVQLTQTWPSVDTLAYLEACIFRDAPAQAQPRYDLAAFDDLLALYALAEVILGDELPPQAELPPQIALLPQAALAQPTEPAPSQLLDLDFSSLEDAPAEPTYHHDVAHTEPDAEPLKVPPLRYATRARAPVTKQPR